MPLTANNNIKEIGHIVSYFSGVAKIRGLPHVFSHEILLDKNGGRIAIVLGFDEDSVDALFFEENFGLSEPVFRSGEIFSLPISEDYLGRVINGLGEPIDGLGEIKGKNAPVFNPAPQIIDREPISVPLSTGIKIIDTTLPLGRGQRQLIVGDRKLGKSTIAIDTVLNQKESQPEVYCVYVIIGQKRSQLEEIVSLFNRENVFTYTAVVAAVSEDSFASQYLAPFVGCAIAEYFMRKGKDALVVYDDLSKHAKVYRDIALLLERAPGREAYPGDIFSLHAFLLERAAKLSKKKGGGSLTALPIIETQEGDVSSFIPTNLISITDGQIYLERSLFEKGFLPAVNVGLSVSRIGSQAQPPILKDVVGNIRLALSQHKELEKLIQLETTVSQKTEKQIYRGDLVLELLKQGIHQNIPWEEQVILFYSVEQGFFDDITKNKWQNFQELLLEMIKNRYQPIVKKIKSGSFNKTIQARIQTIIQDFKKEFLSQ